MRKLKPKETKPIALVFTAFSGVLLGLLIGVYYLLTTPVERLPNEPDPAVLEEPGNYVAYFTPGRVAGAETTNFKTAMGRIQRRAPGPISLSEEELNYFIKTYGSSQAQDEATEGGIATFDQLNVHLVDDRMILSGRMVLDTNGERFEMLTQAEIGFENTEAGPKMFVKEMTFNSLPVPTVAGVARSLIESKLDPESLPEDWVEMWQNIKEVQIESGQLIAQVGLRRA